MTSAEKGARYIAQLYEARCNGHWPEVPELARKVEKHAPGRKCLTLAARAGAAMYQDKNGYSVAESQYGPALSSALDQEELHRDILDGLVTRALVFYGLGQPESALKQIPDSLHRTPAPNGAKAENAWFAVSVIQGTLIRGLSLEALGEPLQAGNTYRSIISYVSRVVALRSQYAELSRWTEELLTHICLYFSMETESRSAQIGEAMAAFHLLSNFLDDQKWRPLGTRASFTGVPPRAVWRAFYEALSRIVKEDLVYHPSPVHRDHETPEHRGLLEDEDFLASRLQQRADLKRVEANYESLLLQETSFPKASETNHEVMGWVELVMSNWRVLCGPSWTDAEVGGGGKVQVGRTTLDVLYRAATKTFHSSQILRHLFTIHAFLGEFDMAFHAFDTYVDIITRGKARVEKSGADVLQLDDDETAVHLAAEAIRVCCRYGAEKAAEKALSIGVTLQKWLEKVSSDSMINSGGEKQESYGENGHAIDPALSRQIVSVAYRAIGISQANYARITYSTTQRAELQNKAIGNFERSLSQCSTDSASTETLYALALVLADQREIPAAVHAVKRALANPHELSSLANSDGILPNQEEEPDSSNPAFSRQKTLLPVWHLLALLLCAREEFDIAEATCDAAFEQFGDSTAFFGQVAEPASSRLSVLPVPSTGIVDRMSLYEKQTVLEIRLTQVCLLENAEGPEAAVNASNELLALYARLFGKIDIASFRPAKTNYSLPPAAKGIVKGSVRSKYPAPQVTQKVSREKYAPLPFPNTSAALAKRPTPSFTMQGSTVNSSEKILNSGSGSLRGSTFGSMRSKPKELKAVGSGTLNEKQSYDAGSPEKQAAMERADLPLCSDSLASPSRSTFVQEYSPVAPRPLPAIANNQPISNLPPPAGGYLQPLRQDTRLPTASMNDSASPVSHFNIMQERRQKVSLLIKVWLFVAGLYVRAALYDDANQAIEEAKKLLTALEQDVSRQGSSMRVFQERTWASSKSIEDLWADVYAERAILYTSQSKPHDALHECEQALSHQPDHSIATVELSKILLDIYCQSIPPEKPDTVRDSFFEPKLPESSQSAPLIQQQPTQHPHTSSGRRPQPSPPELYRLAARDRAYALLSSLTKLGSGWDSAEAWFVLARAYEESGQIEKAKEALWWTVELEDARPIRNWRDVAPGGFVL